MLAQGGGRIINVASMTSFFGSEQIPAYAASKGAVAQLTKALSNEWAGRGGNVNAIAPGYMVTRLTADMQGKNPAQYAEITARIPMHRWGQPEDLQGAVVFLASPAAAYVTGAILPVDGGYLGKWESIEISVQSRQFMRKRNESMGFCGLIFPPEWGSMNL